MGPGDLVVLLAEPLLMGGEMLVIGCAPDGRLLCEAVYYDASGDDPPARGLFDPHELERADVWARAG